MKNRPVDRKFFLIRNVFLILLSLLLLWFMFDMPAFTKEQAFRRAMREHFLEPRDPEIIFGEDGRLAALAEVDGVYVQTRVARQSGIKRWISWQHAFWTETEAVDGVYIIPLVAYGSRTDSPEVAVLAEGNSAELTFVYEGESHPLAYGGKQDGWFLFRFVRDGSYNSSHPSRYDAFLESMGYMRLGTLPAMDHGSFLFLSYDAAGNELKRVEKQY